MKRSVRLFLGLTIVLVVAAGAYVHHRGGMKYLEYRRYSIARQLFSDRHAIPEKVWLHQCNSPEKIRRQGSRFTGFELDVIYDAERAFFINAHDPVDETKMTPPDLVDTLRAVSELGRPVGLWIDYKNLTAENARPSLEVLKRLTAEFGLKAPEIIVESGNFEQLKLFREAGYQTSFYFPYYKDSALQSGEAEQLLKKAIAAEYVNFVSFESRYHSFVAPYCRAEGKPMLAWALNRSLYLTLESGAADKLLADDDVKIVLLPEQGLKYR